MIPPSGGLRDSLPPKLFSALPKDSASNVSPKNIILTFDEYVSVQDVQRNLIVSPTLKYEPLVDYKLRNVTLKIKDTLEANTTYSFNFGEAIKDVNEGNIARGFTYVFSTGATVDYHTYKGKVYLAETGKIDSELIVILHNNLADSAITKLKPRYYTHLNGKGEFTFKYLPAGRFNVYVLKNTFTKKYDDSTLVFAFSNQPVEVNENTKPDTLYAYEEVKAKPISPVSSALKLPGTNRDDKRLRYATNFDNGQQDLLSPFILTFNRKIKQFDSTKILLTDSNFVPLKGYTVKRDSTNTKLVISYSWKELTPFRLLLPKEAIADSAGTGLTKTDTLRFITKKEADYGSLRLRFGNLDLQKNPVLQLVQNGNIVESVVLKEPEFKRKLIIPGSYDLRILFDANRNGVWDTGHFPGKKRQPEIVRSIAKPLVIRPNWDNEVTIPLN